jgi:heme exporter protein D
MEGDWGEKEKRKIPSVLSSAFTQCLNIALSLLALFLNPFHTLKKKKKLINLKNIGRKDKRSYTMRFFVEFQQRVFPTIN